MHKTRKLFAASALAMASVMAVPASAVGDTLPSGQVVVGHTTIEPAYDDMTGQLVYLSTPMGTQQGGQVHVTAHNVAPLYLPMYPAASTVGTLNCQHMPMDNCPDHGPIVSGIAQGAVPTVYGAGVLGHDHLVGIALTGGDFNVVWLPVLVLFTPAATTEEMNTHITTLAQIQALESEGHMFEIPLPPAAFKCASVSAAVYNHGTPVTPV